MFYWKCWDAVVKRLCVNPSVLLDLSLTSDDPVNGRFLIALPTEEMTIPAINEPSSNGF